MIWHQSIDRIRLTNVMLRGRIGSAFQEINDITNIMKSLKTTNIFIVVVFISLLCSCTTVTYPNGTTVTTPYVAPVYGAYYPGYYGSPYGTYGVYGGGYFPVYGYGYGGCWNRPYWNNYSGGNCWGGWNRCNTWNGGWRRGCNR